METKEIILPDGWEVKEVVGNKIRIGEKGKKELPKTWQECARIVDNVELINIDSEVEGYAVSDFDEGPTDEERRVIPAGIGKPMLALCQLLVCRNAWWKQLGWKPDWKNCSTVKHCIQPFSEKIDKSTNRTGSVVLAFPTIEIRDQFLETFRDLIEEAKELL